VPATSQSAQRGRPPAGPGRRSRGNADRRADRPGTGRPPRWAGQCAGGHRGHVPGGEDRLLHNARAAIAANAQPGPPSGV